MVILQLTVWVIYQSDIATIDENGYGQIVGRIKDMLIRGGNTITGK